MRDEEDDYEDDYKRCTMIRQYISHISYHHARQLERAIYLFARLLAR